MHYSELVNKDFQNRGGSYPKSDVPTDIYDDSDGLVFAFKNTSEDSAMQWTTKYLKGLSLEFNKIRVDQTGDYHDDWVEVSVGFK